MGYAKHTPGPWKVAFGDHSSLWIASPKHKTGDAPIAKVLIEGHFADPSPNAALIAAAPELLEALEAICEQINDEAQYPALRHIVDDALVAIAKAKGGE